MIIDQDRVLKADTFAYYWIMKKLFGLGKKFDRNTLRAEQQRSFRSISTTDCVLKFAHRGIFFLSLNWGEKI